MPPGAMTTESAVNRMEAKQRNRNGQSGEIMLEAAIIFLPVMILLLAMLSLGFWFYQTAMGTNVASEIAAEVARNLKFEKLDAYGDTLDDVRDATDLRMFRSTFRLSELEDAQEQRAQDYADWRIPLSTLGFGPQNLEVELELERSGIGRTHVKVTVHQETDFFLSGILKYAGIVEDHPVFGGVAYAECVDLMEYTSMVNLLWYGSEELSVLSAFGDFYVQAKKLLNL